MNKKIGMFLILLISILSFAPLANAAGGSRQGWKIDPAVMYLYQSQTNSGSTTTSNRYLADLGLGYVFNSPLYLGALYSYDNTTTTGAGITSKDVYTSYGPSIGLVTENIYMTFTYFISSQYDTGSSTTTSYTNGNGYQLSLGYMFSLGSSSYVGPQFSYRSLHYTQRSNPSGSVDYTYATLLPYVAFSFSL